GLKVGRVSATRTLPLLILPGITAAVANPPVGDEDHGKFDASKIFTNDATAWTFTLDAGGNIKEVKTQARGLYQVVALYKRHAPGAAVALTTLINWIPSTSETFNA